ncbi:MAG: hypothetical protein QOF40_1074 [Actinomycetota bacterium]|nr:hypothetical protein [Actinomycetota bacterium]
MSVVSMPGEVLRLLGDGPVEGLVVAGYDHAGKLCGVAKSSQHRALSWVKVWELEALAAELAARSVVVFVFPIGPALAPTAHELAVFTDLLARTRRACVVLLDCYVHRGGRMWSLRELHEGRASA